MSRTPREVYDDHVAALASLDVEAVVADYSPEAVLASNEGIGRGHDHIRAVFAAYLGAPTQIVPTVEVRELGEVVFVTWTAPSSTGTVSGADTFVVRDGLIEAHTGFFTGSPSD